MEINRSWLWAAGGALGFGVLVWLVAVFSPGRQLARSFDRLLDATEVRDWKAVRRLVADDYRDQWGFRADDAILRASEAMQHFAVLEIQADPRRVTRDGRRAEIAAPVRLFGRGSPLAEAAKNHINALSGEFQFAWERKSWKPWDWKLVSIRQHELQIDPTFLP